MEMKKYNITEKTKYTPKKKKKGKWQMFNCKGQEILEFLSVQNTL